MGLAVLLSRHQEADNCDWYFINITIDVVIGIFIIYFIVKGLQRIGKELNV